MMAETMLPPRHRAPVDFLAHIAATRARLESFGQLGLVEEVAAAHTIAVDAVLAPVVAWKTQERARAVREAIWRRMWFERFLSTVQIAELFGADRESVRRAVRRA